MDLFKKKEQTIPKTVSVTQNTLTTKKQGFDISKVEKDDLVAYISIGIGVILIVVGIFLI